MSWRLIEQNCGSRNGESRSRRGRSRRATAASSSTCGKRAIDHDLFRSIPVDLMFRYNFVPLQAQNGTLEIAIADPRNLNLIDELTLLLNKKLRVKVATLSQISDLLKKTEQSQRVLEEVTEGFTLDVVGGRRRSGRDALHRQADRRRQRHRADHQAGRHHHLQRARAARERHSHRNARPGSGHQVPHRRRAALRHAADRARTGTRPSFRASRS